MSNHSMSRRSFVSIAAMTALATALDWRKINAFAAKMGPNKDYPTVVIGGTALFGGEGTIIGTLLGAALLTVVRNGLVQIGGEGRLQEAFLGAIIIFAVLIHTHLRTSNRR